MRGADLDRDRHRSNKCAQSPGDDCDDSAETGVEVFPGHKEICDGRDNDCNGKKDLGDGLGLSGQMDPLTTAGSVYNLSPVIAWAPEANVYGVAYMDDFSIHLTTMSKAGVRDLPGKKISNGADVDPQIGWNGKAFGVLWNWGAPVSAPAKTDVSFQQVDPDGNLVGVETTPSAQTFVSAKAASVIFPGQWALFWTDASSKTVSGYETSIVPISTTLGSGAGRAAAAVSGNKVLVAYRDSLSVIRRSLRDQNLANPTDDAVSTKGSTTSDDNVVVTALSNGFGIAWKRDPNTTVADDEVLQYAELGTDGSFICGPVTLPTPIKNWVPGAIAANSFQRVITLHDPSNNSRDIVQLFKGCEWGERQSIYRTAIAGTASYAASIAAAGDDGFAVVWSDNFEAGKRRIVRRIFGPYLCQ
jgi:hypothetical protein